MLRQALGTAFRTPATRGPTIGTEPWNPWCASLERLATSDPPLAGTAVVGGFWTRTGSVEVDLVGVDQWPGASRVSVVGWIKWRARSPFDQRDLTDLAAHRAEVPGGRDAALVAVSRSGYTARDLAAVYGPDDLVSAWR